MMQIFIQIIKEHEDWLIERVLSYAKSQNYTKYTSTLKEAWRISIQGISHSIIQAISAYQDIPNFYPEENFAEDILSNFGIQEAARHRARGVKLGMFLGLFKYYKQAYLDLVSETANSNKEKALFFINRVFDRMELGFCTAWVNLSEEKKQQELQDKNLEVVNEKNKYLTIIESLSTPVILLNPKKQIEYINYEGCRLLGISETPGGYYYHHKEIEIVFPGWLKKAIKKFLDQEDKECYFECMEAYQEKDRYFVIQINRMLDVSLKFQGILVILYDITQQEKIRQRNEMFLQNKVDDRTKRLEKSLKELKEKEEIQSILLKEVNHRVKNNLSALISMLHIEEDHLEKQQGGQSHNLLKGLIQRIQGLSTVHTMLSKREWKSLNLSELCLQIIKNVLPGEPFDKKINIQIEPCTIEINGHQAHHLTLVLNELAANTIKHALPQKNTVKIEIDIKKMERNIVLVFKDDGPGYPESIVRKDFSCACVGFELIQGIVTQSLGGEVEFHNHHGAVAIVSFPLES
ncbi:MAG: hypothetical protein HUU50_17145 [Candidatus Brocadiae bacterium]|nr:hypothetical protein [Candidatus Brocadiia bacterium]